LATQVSRLTTSSVVSHHNVLVLDAGGHLQVALRVVSLPVSAADHLGVFGVGAGLGTDADGFAVGTGLALGVEVTCGVGTGTWNSTVKTNNSFPLG
jgi:hypothetical protein